MFRSPAAAIRLGPLYLLAIFVLVITEARLGSPIFFAVAGVGAAIYLSLLAAIWRAPAPASRHAFFLGLAFAVAFRVPLATPPVKAGNDIFRYVWDGRVQRLGHNPYAVVPSDPALAGTHREDTTRMMQSRNWRTPYPPAAQLFFRLMVSIRDSPDLIKLALIACDLLTIVIVWRWLLATGRSEWLTLAYAWHPLVVLEVAHSGHIDALTTMWIALAAYALARRRTLLASTAFVLAVMTKLLPIVLAPIFWRRIRVRDGIAAFALLILLWLPFATGGDPLIAVNNVVDHIRFNGHVFWVLATTVSPRVAASIALGLGLIVAAWCRYRYAEDEPAAWAWPMAASLVCAPVIYSWYLLALTPFLLVPRTLPIIVWTLSVLPLYIVWENSLRGEPWVVSPLLTIVELAPPAMAIAVVAWSIRRRRDAQG